VVRANHYRYSTSTCKPNHDGQSEWHTDFSIPLTRANPNRGVSIIVWDRDRLRKTYIGEIVLPWNDLFSSPTAEKENVSLSFLVLLRYYWGAMPPRPPWVGFAECRVKSMFNELISSVVLENKMLSS
jgi:hypothetical protein